MESAALMKAYIAHPALFHTAVLYAIISVVTYLAAKAG